jgi:dynein heavy chain
MLTLASGDRIPMSDTTKLMFENEHLDHASPATVSRAGIVYLSDTDLGWQPLVASWIARQAFDVRQPLEALFQRYIAVGGGTSTTPLAAGAPPLTLFEHLAKVVKFGVTQTVIGCVSALTRLLGALLKLAAGVLASGSEVQLLSLQLVRVCVVAWCPPPLNPS